MPATLNVNESPMTSQSPAVKFPFTS